MNKNLNFSYREVKIKLYFFSPQPSSRTPWHYPQTPWRSMYPRLRTAIQRTLSSGKCSLIRGPISSSG